MSNKKYIKVTQLHSTAGRLPVHKACIKGLGLKRIRHTVEVENTPANWGMINKVIFLVKVEESK
jgi:large subunit ribosomal protein L30